ncbi:MAG: bifunctional 5,10-methylenetetrahydrofolate dehydrogenase/5,10-methenyltetrahydrofolate cyclohydrolase [bacterium]|nr:bifunctional 5,10-methylenetetrahydrofolate dehydrogenase/5,10-methenyltetrahydrofolate cyclohydrolase [bacterium]
MKLLYGKPIAEPILGKIKEAIQKNAITPGLGVILVGDDESSKIYVGLKEKKAKEVGIYFEKAVFPVSTSFEEVAGKIEEFNKRENIHGIIVQLPLPKHLDAEKLIKTIDPAKDADGFHPQTIEKFLNGEFEYCPVFPKAVLELLRASGTPLARKHASLIVNSELFGTILSKALRKDGVISKVFNKPEKEELLKSDIVISATGKAWSITGEMIKEGAIIIDGGISSVSGKTVGDVDQDGVSQKAGFLSPVPGGVGPLTVAFLLKRVCQLALGTEM